VTGISFSIIHGIAFFLFACLNLTFVFIKHNPDVSVFDEADQHMTEEDGIRLNEVGFQIAISVTDAGSGDIKHDLSKIDWMLVVWADGNDKEYVGGLHPCTEADYAKFYKRSIAAKGAFDRYKKANALMCMNEVDNKGEKVNMTLFGAVG
jgi:hypothetical protein